MRKQKKKNRFDDFFEEQSYAVLKNYLYNYRLRSAAVNRYLNTQKPMAILETGSGLSPVSRNCVGTVYSDLSFSALEALKRITPQGKYVVADCCNLPFKSHVFSHVISSEVLEHIHNDKLALMEMARVTTRSGQLVITFPHRKCYYAQDDHYVGHLRRYELSDIENQLKCSGMKIKKVEKILGPLEKLSMLMAVNIYDFIQKRIRRRSRPTSMICKYQLVKMFQLTNALIMAPFWLEARIFPWSFASVLMIIGGREHSRYRD